MLTHIHITHFAIVECLELHFYPGLNVLTGETGAGKSIWVDALSLALGQRADTSAISPGHNQCDITLTFDIRDNQPAKHWLAEHELQSDDTECLLRRTINKNGSSRSYINGRPSPLQLTRELACHLLQSHRQHQAQSLLKREHQQEMLDQYAKHDAWLTSIQSHYARWRYIQNELSALQEKSSTAKQEQAFLQFQLEELQALNLSADEWTTLSEEHQNLHQTQSLNTELQQALQVLDGEMDTSIINTIEHAKKPLSLIKNPDNKLTDIIALLTTATIHLQEATGELQHYCQQISSSPERIAEIEQRLSQLHDMARKHRVDPKQLPEVMSSLQAKLEILDSLDEQIASLTQEADTCVVQYQQIAKKLTQSRKKAGKTLNQHVSQQLQALGMEGSQFMVSFETLDGEIHPAGQERVHFLISTNRGHDAQPLNKIVSGGELSRISLALQLLLTEQVATPSLIFDEVDTGIGGQTADTIGQLLGQLGKHTQVLCITHLPQVAAYASHHFKAEKQHDGNTTQTRIALLDQEERVDEIARMLGGKQITKQTRANAEELLSLSG